MSLRIDPSAMDVVRLGLGFRALRRRRGWSQERLARGSNVSRSVIWRVERGRADRVTVATLEAVAAALDGRLDVRVLWHGENLDRLVDARHARLVDLTVALLDRAGWTVATEASFNLRGERGSIDVLAFRSDRPTLLVIEVKSVVADLQATLHGIDRKARVALAVGRERGWQAKSVSRLLILPSDKTARRRVAMHRATFRAALPATTLEVRRWLRSPTGTMSGILFVSDVRHKGEFP